MISAPEAADVQNSRGQRSVTGPLVCLDTILGSAPSLAPSERPFLDRLAGFRDRLTENRFQLAVIGQFKRGKSSLLNALLDCPVLPTGVVPLTALPVFIRYATTPVLQLIFSEREPRQLAFESADSLRDALQQYATETGNPRNEKGIARIEIGIPASLLEDGLVLIDTPGIGSAERHNSETAMAALPECDGVLAVLSPDPPITEAEAAYFGEVASHASLILPVLTKIDLVMGADRTDTITYCQRVLERIGIRALIVPVSIVATPDQPDAVARDGIERLRRHVRSLDPARRSAILQDAITRKSWGSITHLQFQNDLAMAALRSPIESLRHKVSLLQRASQELQVEQSLVLDHIAAEAGRLRDDLDAQTHRLREQITGRLLAVVDQSGSNDRTAMFAQLASRVAEIFPAVFEEMSARERDRLEQIAERAMGRVRPLLTRARETAAEVMGVEVRAPEAVVKLSVPTELGWRQRPAESMNPLAPGMIESMLPMAVRARVLRSAMRREANRLAMLNAEHLRWTLRQACDEALRSFAGDVGIELTAAIGSVVELGQGVLRKREAREDEAEGELQRRSTWAEMLAEAADALRRSPEGGAQPDVMLAREIGELDDDRPSK